MQCVYMVLIISSEGSDSNWFKPLQSALLGKDPMYMAILLNIIKLPQLSSHSYLLPAKPRFNSNLYK